jgi:hypothetical protein
MPVYRDVLYAYSFQKLKRISIELTKRGVPKCPRDYMRLLPALVFWYNENWQRILPMWSEVVEELKSNKGNEPILTDDAPTLLGEGAA